MTDDLTYCVRGCVAPCECSACMRADSPIHKPNEREADTGLLCKQCASRLRRWIEDIPDLYATLPLVPEVGEQSKPTGKHHGPPGSASPIRLDVVALQDPRTAATDRSSGEQWDGSTYIPQEVGTWALLLAEERNISSGVHTLTEATGLMLRWFEELCAMPWVDECYDALRDVNRLLQNAHGVVRPRPFARCIAIYERDGEYVTCGQQLYAPKPGDKIRCRSCGRRYDGFGLQALADSVGVADGGTARRDPAHVRAQ